MKSFRTVDSVNAHKNNNIHRYSVQSESNINVTPTHLSSRSISVSTPVTPRSPTIAVDVKPKIRSYRKQKRNKLSCKLCRKANKLYPDIQTALILILICLFSISTIPNSALTKLLFPVPLHLKSISVFSLNLTAE